MHHLLIATTEFAGAVAVIRQRGVTVLMVGRGTPLSMSRDASRALLTVEERDQFRAAIGAAPIASGQSIDAQWEYGEWSEALCPPELAWSEEKAWTLMTGGTPPPPMDAVCDQPDTARASGTLRGGGLTVGSTPKLSASRLKQSLILPGLP